MFTRGLKYTVKKWPLLSSPILISLFLQVLLVPLLFIAWLPFSCIKENTIIVILEECVCESMVTNWVVCFFLILVIWPFYLIVRPRSFSLCREPFSMENKDIFLFNMLGLVGFFGVTLYEIAVLLYFATPTLVKCQQLDAFLMKAAFRVLFFTGLAAICIPVITFFLKIYPHVSFEKDTLLQDE